MTDQNKKPKYHVQKLFIEQKRKYLLYQLGLF